MHTECNSAFERQDPDRLCDGWDFYEFERGSTLSKDEIAREVAGKS